jgi:hypothetical protein
MAEEEEMIQLWGLRQVIKDPLKTKIDENKCLNC